MRENSTESEVNDAFDVLILVARPAAGKSEVIDYLKRLSPEERLRGFHLRNFDEIDDFPMLWTWFEEDGILADMGKPRLHTDAEGYFKQPYLWNLLIERICLEYKKKLRDPAYHERKSTLIEFSRGREHGGYAGAFAHLSPSVKSRAAVLYLRVSYEESLRKNRKRFNPERPDSILEHGLPDEKLERLYREVDWEEFSSADPAFLLVDGSKIPYAVMENEDDVTSAGGAALGERLEEALERLWKNRRRLDAGGPS
jgi:hypothetical protein